MKKLLLLASLPLLLPLYAAEEIDSVMHEEDPSALSDTILVVQRNAALIESTGATLEEAQEGVSKTLEKRKKYLSQEEQLEVKIALRNSLIEQILEVVHVLDEELASAAVDEQKTSEEAARLQRLWSELVESHKGNIEEADEMADPIRMTVAEKQEEQGRKRVYLERLQERIKGIKEGIRKQESQGSMNVEELKKVREVIHTLEKQAVELGEKHHGAAGQATLEVLRERVAERQPQQQTEEQSGGYFSWMKCVIH